MGAFLNAMQQTKRNMVYTLFCKQKVFSIHVYTVEEDINYAEESGKSCGPF